MKNKKGLLILFSFSLILIYVYVISFTNIFENNLVINWLVLVVLALLGLYIISLVHNKEKNTSIKAKDRLFKSLMQNSDTVYIMLNAKNKKVLFLSDNVEDILGIKVEEKNDDDIVLNVFNIPIIKSELNNWDGKQTYVSQMVSYDNPKYSHQMWIRIKMFSYSEKNGNESYYVVEVMDATKEHDRQHLLVTQATDIKARELKLNEITAASYDMEMNINLINNTYDLKYFKKDNLYFGEERRGTYTEELNNILQNYINENDRDEFYSNLSIDSLKEHFNKYELDSITIRYRLGNKVKDNTWLESTIFFLSSRQNNKVSVLTKNVTQNAESIREQNVLLQNALNDVKLADKAKTDLITTISHDIRTPLTNIIGFSESLLKKDLNEGIKDDIKNIYSSSNDMLSMIDELLDPSKVEKKIIEKNEKQYSILKMFKKIETQVKDYIENKNLKFNISLDNNLPVVLYGDFKRITQAIINVINNSIKYTEEGQINVNVRGEKIDTNVNLIIEISDTGIGMSEEKLKEIMTSNDKNTGIGSVKSLINLLDGKLEIESKEAEYTKVTLSFLQRIVEDNKVRELINTNKKAEIFSLKGKSILIVDDNKLNLKVTSKLLEPFEVNITLLETGQECIDLIKEGNSFDLIMMDQMMPVMDGTTTLKKLKEIEKFNIPVIVLTADAMVGQKEKYINDGFSDYISKPIDKQELARVLKKFLKNQD